MRTAGAFRYRWFTGALRGLVLLSLLMQIGLLVRPDESFLMRPIVEDAYYSISVARSIAAGDGFSVDGESLTNGVQPLICLIYTPLFWVADGDPVTPLRGVLAVSIVIGILGALLFGTLLVRLRSDRNPVPSDTVRWTGIAGYLVNYSLTTHLLNGLETGLSIVMLLALIHTWISVRDSADPGAMRHAVRLGFLLGIAVLVRIDAVLLGIALVLLFLRMRWRSASGIGSTDVTWIGVTTLIALLVSSPWWIYNILLLGHPLPVSGQSQADLASERWDVVRATISTVSDAILPGLHTPTGWTVGGLFIGGLAVVALGILLGVVSQPVATFYSRFGSALRRDWVWSRLDLLLGAAVLFLLAYTIFFAAPHFQTRYLISLRLIGVVLFGTILLTAIGRSAASRPARASTLAILGGLILALSLPLMTRHYRGLYSNIMLEPVEWIRQNTRPDQSIGMFQSGTAGYFFPERVVNLDGKVNVAAHRYFRAGRLGAYVDSMEFAYIIDWPLYTNRVFVASPTRLRYHPVDTLPHSGMIVWRHRPAETSDRRSP